MSTDMIYIIAGLLAIGIVIVIRSVMTQRGKRRSQAVALEHLGFLPCPDQQKWLEETVAFIENNSDYQYEVRDPKRLSGKPTVYYFVKMRHRYHDEPGVAEEDILFPLKRQSAAGLLLIVKPSSLPTGLATRMMGALATGPWDAQPDDLQRCEIPPDLKNTNLVGVLGPPNANLYDLIDATTLGVVLSFGDAGGTFVQFRDTWCLVSSASAQIPFRAGNLIASIRPLL